MIFPTSFALCFFISIATVTAQTWTTVPKWADFGLYGPAGFKDLDFKLEFMMDNYEIISLEKCLRNEENMDHMTEKHFVNLTSKMRALRPDAEVKILNYWAVMFTQIHCYEAANDLLANPNLWLKDDLGYPVYSDKRGNAYYDFRMEEARNLWIKAGIDPVLQTNGGANGVFLDGTGRKKLQNCRLKTCGEDKESCCVFSKESEQAFNEGLYLAVESMRDLLHEIDPGYILIGNGLMNGNGNTPSEELVEFLDGFCFEHVMSFEGVDKHAEGPPFIKIVELEKYIQLKNLLVEKDKYVFVRSFPGPVGTPINHVGGLPTPQLPENYPYPKPQNNLEVQQAMKDLFAFPLAVYLCAFADEKVFYTYSVWYDVSQSVPCMGDQKKCQFPADFDEYLKMNPGPPLEAAKWEGRVCSRRFTKFGISVNLEDENSATWFP